MSQMGQEAIFRSRRYLSALLSKAARPGFTSMDPDPRYHPSTEAVCPEDDRSDLH
jgi:hypothetical protein